MEGTEAMKDERESNPLLLRTRLAIMAAILAVGIAALTSSACRNSAAPPRTDASVMWGSFATSAPCEDRACQSPVLSVPGGGRAASGRG
jgi:hypothetical protein